MRRWVFLAGIIGLLLLITPVLMVIAILGGEDQTSTAAAACSTATGNAPTAAVQLSQLDPQQQINAGIIIAEGRAMGVSDQGLVIALATARQEEDLHNDLVPNDHDSVGLFQQRPSQGWGTAAQVGDPHYSSQEFFKALLAVPGWASMAVTDAAQRVQRSAAPTAYAKWESLARAIVGAAGGTVTAMIPVSCTTAIGTGSEVLAAIAFARSQLGQPYQFGGTGPLYDCSGLMQAAWAAAGVTIPRDTYGQVTIGTAVAQSDLHPGDLVFTDPGHVQMVTSVDNGKVMIIEDPETGSFVHEIPIRGFWQARRVVAIATLVTASGGFALPLPRSVLNPSMISKPHHDHPGADLAAPTGTPIYAVEGGTVTTAGPVSGYGNNFVSVKDAAGWTWYYGHGSAHNVTVGQTVKAGDQIASVGSEGFSTGPHLHLGLNAPGQTVPTSDPSSCPQDVMTALWNGQPLPALGRLSTTACIGGSL